MFLSQAAWTVQCVMAMKEVCDDEGGSVEGGDEEENLKKFVQDSILRLVEMKQKMGCSINHFEELLQWGKDLHTSENNDAAIHWPRNWDGVQLLLN